MTRNDAADWLRRNLPTYTQGMDSRRILEDALSKERRLERERIGKLTLIVPGTDIMRVTSIPPSELARILEESDPA